MDFAHDAFDFGRISDGIATRCLAAPEFIIIELHDAINRHRVIGTGRHGHWRTALHLAVDPDVILELSVPTKCGGATFSPSGRRAAHAQRTTAANIATRRDSGSERNVVSIELSGRTEQRRASPRYPPSVIAPRLAVDTSFMYLASSPRV